MPIVFIVAENPVKRGLVVSLARPAGNLTGINFLTNELVAKRLEPETRQGIVPRECEVVHMSLPIPPPNVPRHRSGTTRGRHGAGTR